MKNNVCIMFCVMLLQYYFADPKLVFVILVCIEDTETTNNKRSF